MPKTVSLQLTTTIAIRRRKSVSRSVYIRFWWAACRVQILLVECMSGSHQLHSCACTITSLEIFELVYIVVQSSRIDYISLSPWYSKLSVSSKLVHQSDELPWMQLIDDHFVYLTFCLSYNILSSLECCTDREISTAVACILHCARTSTNCSCTDWVVVQVSHTSSELLN